MIRLIGCACVVVATSAIGFQVAKGYRERPREIRNLSEALRLLRAEIEYTATPLPLALKRVSAHLSGTVQVLFEQAATAITRQDTTVTEALKAGLEASKGRAHLTERDIEVLSTFGRTLGTSDSTHQSLQFEAALAQLENLEKEAEEAQGKYERMWQYIGILAGIFLVILLY